MERATVKTIRKQGLEMYQVVGADGQVKETTWSREAANYKVARLNARLLSA